MKEVRILIIDDHTIFRESLRRLLAGEAGFEVIGDCATIGEAEEILSRTEIDIVLLDYDLGEDAGTDLLRHLKATEHKTRVLMLTGGMLPSAALSAIDMGAAGIVLKHSGTQQLLAAIHRVSDGEAWWDTAIVRSALATVQDKTVVPGNVRELTERQRKVLRGILDGLSNKEVAGRLEVSETAVKATIQELFSKAGVRTRSQLVRVAIERFASAWLRSEQ